MKFYNHLKQKIKSSLKNNHSNNFEFYLFGKESNHLSLLKSIRRNIRYKLCLIKVVSFFVFLYS